MARRQGNAKSAAKPAAASATAQQDDLSPDSLAAEGDNAAGDLAAGNAGQDAHLNLGSLVAVTVAPGAVAAGPQQAAASAVDNTAGLQATGDEPVAALWVRSVSDQGFRRCGIRFSPEGRYIREDDLDEEQLKELVNDRSLVVEATWYSEKDLG